MQFATVNMFMGRIETVSMWVKFVQNPVEDEYGLM